MSVVCTYSCCTCAFKKPIKKSLLVVGSELFHALLLSPCSLGHGFPGVHAVHAAESVRGLDSEPGQEASVQTSAVGTVSGFHGCRCRRSRHTGCTNSQPGVIWRKKEPRELNEARVVVFRERCCCGSSTRRQRVGIAATTRSRAWRVYSSWPCEWAWPCCWPPSSTRSSPRRGAP